MSAAGTRVTVAAADVRVGDRLFARDMGLLVSRIDEGFFGRPEMLAFVEDTDERWLKMPMMSDAEVEILRAGD